MGIRASIHDLAGELEDYVGVVGTLVDALDDDMTPRESAAAFVLYKGLDAVVSKMKVLGDHIIVGDPNLTLKGALARRHWVQVDEGGWYLATQKQIDLIKEVLNNDSLQEPPEPEETERAAAAGTDPENQGGA